MKFRINIEEVINETFEIEASNLEEAIELAKQQYDDGELVLEPGNLISKSISGYSEDTGEWSEYEEF